MMMIYHWRRGPKNTEVTPLQRPGSGSYGCGGSQVAISAMLERVAKGVRKIGRRVRKKKVVPQLEANCYLPCMCKGLFHSLSLFPSPSLPLFFSPCSALGNCQLTVCPGPWYLTGRLMLFYSPPNFPRIQPFYVYTPHTHTPHTCNVYAHMLTHTLTQSH